MFDRFSENAKAAMTRARAAAARQGAGYLDAEHVLLGMLEQDGSNAARVLTTLGVDVASLREALATMLPPGGREDEGQMPFAPAVKDVLQLAMADAVARRHNHVGTQHVLMGIVRHADNDAARVLARVGVDEPTLDRAMTDAIPMSERSRLQLLLISNSTMHGGGYLEHCKHEIEAFLDGSKRLMFVPFALADHDGYASKARRAFADIGKELLSVHTYDDKVAALADADAVFVGGGNTFRLLSAMHHYGLLAAIRERALAGMPYMGSSAGTNVATPSIRTTNDMPIVQPPSFTALGLVPFQINPHYLDPDPGSRHMGETREERIRQFHEEHEVPVLGLREGCMLRVDGASMMLRGTTDARLFRRAAEPEEFTPPCDLSFLLED
ncbi:MAG: dipeptidase PepE [Planctomycetes bacterium]|nr:dipeptidase PepE [Planctomycetota bacterium]